MRLFGIHWRILVFSVGCWATVAPALAQEPAPSRQSPDVIRVNTSLIQTDVMVFDKQGTFVDGLKREQFVLKVDGKPREISFFERVVAGSRNEESQLAAARGKSPGGVQASNGGAVPLDRGRTVFFFLDDLHLSPGSAKYTRTLLDRFIDHEMGQNDEAAIVSPSGQVGFLQQLTDDKRVLKAATQRIASRVSAIRDSQRPVMSEYQAQLIEAGHDDVFTYFVDELLRFEPNLSRDMAASIIHGRATSIVQQTDTFTNGTLNALRAMVKNAAGLPGRKLVFLISDGFLLDYHNGDANDRLHQITAAAAASGVIIYSIDAHGLQTGTADASTEMPFDPAGRLARAAGGEGIAYQDGTNALAVDTGGRAFRNSNDLSIGVTTGLKETSAYYLLAWRPEGDEQRRQKSPRVEVSVSGRPDWSVRFHHGFGDSSAAESAAQKKESEAGPKAVNELLGETLRAAYPKSDLPVSISLNFLDLEQYGSTLTASIKVSTSALVLEAQDGLQIAVLDLAGGVYDVQGKPVSSFNKHLTIKSKAAEPNAPPPDSVFYNHFCVIKPGLYQVRVAAVDPKKGRVGSATRWIEIPDLGSKALTLSTLIVGERKSETESAPPSTADASDPSKAPEALRRVFLNVDHRFARSSLLRFVTFVYNASGTTTGDDAMPKPPPGPGTAVPPDSVPTSSQSAAANNLDLAVQVQLFRDNEPVITMPLHKIQTDGVADLRRLPYAAEVTLDGLQSGRYVLLVTVIDRGAKASASQRFGFQLD